MFKIFMGTFIEDLETDANEWLLHNGVRIVKWEIMDSKRGYSLVIEYAWNADSGL